MVEIHEIPEVKMDTKLEKPPIAAIFFLVGLFILAAGYALSFSVEGYVTFGGPIFFFISAFVAIIFFIVAFLGFIANFFEKRRNTEDKSKNIN